MKMVEGGHYDWILLVSGEFKAKTIILMCAYNLEWEISTILSPHLPSALRPWSSPASS